MPPPFARNFEDNPKKFSFKEQISLLKEFVSYYPRHKKLFFIDLVSVMASPLLTTAVPYLIFRVLNDFLPSKNLMMLGIFLSGVFVLTLLNIASEYVRTKWGHTLGVRMEADMRRDLFSHVQKLSFSYFDRTKTGHIMSRISNDLTMIAEIAHHCPEDIISATLMIICGLWVMLSINPLLTLLTLIPVPLAVFWGGSFQMRMRRSFSRVRREVADINSRVENSIQGVREVKSYTNEKIETDKFKSVNNRFRKARENSFSLLALFHSGMMFFFHGYSVIFLALGIMMVYAGNATIPELVTFFMYSNQITMPVMRLVEFAEQYQQGMAAFERFSETMKEVPEVADRPGALQNVEGGLKGRIVFDDVVFKYPDMKEDEKNVLDHVSLELPSGTTAALVGESGAGKTTLASLVPRFYDVSGGRVTVDGIDVRDFSQKYLRSSVGIVQQMPFLFDTTIKENILFGRPDASDEEVVEAAKNANVYDFIASLPDGFNSMCGEHGVRLSGGQRQRISLARVFLKDPRILIFDEATSSLDNQSEALIKESIGKLCSGRTTLIIAHRLSTVKDAETIFCMKNGKIVERGSHAELLALGGYYKELYTMHSF